MDVRFGGKRDLVGLSMCAELDIHLSRNLQLLFSDPRIFEPSSRLKLLLK